MPDAAGRTQNCQACHPTHWQAEKIGCIYICQISSSMHGPALSFFVA